MYVSAQLCALGSWQSRRAAAGVAEYLKQHSKGEEGGAGARAGVSAPPARAAADAGGPRHAEDGVDGGVDAGGVDGGASADAGAAEALGCSADGAGPWGVDGTGVDGAGRTHARGGGGGDGAGVDGVDTPESALDAQLVALDRHIGSIYAGEPVYLPCGCTGRQHRTTAQNDSTKRPA